jgi:uncharacterized membrane protein
MKRLQLLVAAFSLFIGLAAFVPSVVHADAKSTVCTTLGSNAGCTKTANGSVDLNTIIKVVIQILSTIIGVVSVIMIMVGGFRYITSNGDSSNVKSAKDTITYAVVGLVIVAFAQIIVKYVLAKATGHK